MKRFFVAQSQKIIALILLLTAAFGAGRLYFEVTDGFREKNIHSILAYDANREVAPLSQQEEEKIKTLLKQPFYYLAKGCQSYCFISSDDQYVLKFFKYQRYETSPWLKPFSFIPSIRQHLTHRKEHKSEKLSFFMQAWKTAFDNLKEESGLVYLHLNKTTYLNQPITFFDKMGFRHVVEADKIEFLIQRKGESLSHFLKEADFEGGKEMLDQILALLQKEYTLGITDGDPALLQNTGVYENQPFHIDVGQFYIDEALKKDYKQDLFNRTYELRIWLRKNNPKLETYLTARLKEIIGTGFDTLKPYFGRIRET